MTLQPAAEMRRKAEEVIDAIAGRERRKVAGLILDASNRGALSVTYYDPISEPLFRELGELGYQVKSDERQGRNETDWEVTISWAASSPFAALLDDRLAYPLVMPLK